MIITKNLNGTSLEIALEGRLDTTTAPELEQELKNSMDGANTLTLDFSKLDYISSAGLRDFFDRGADEDVSSFTSPLLLPAGDV